MDFTIQQAGYQDILLFRNLYLQELNAYNRYHAYHERGWADQYLIMADGSPVGYGSVKGRNEFHDRDAVFEFYIIPPFRSAATKAFLALLRYAKVKYIEGQSNDQITSGMLYRFCENVYADTVLFKDHHVTELKFPGQLFRPRREDDIVFSHQVEPVGGYVVESNGEVLATGGFMTHYNFPFADVYMEVHNVHHRKGYGSFLVQELKKITYAAGRVPGARCSVTNPASRACLLKAGFAEAGFMLAGAVKDNPGKYV